MSPEVAAVARHAFEHRHEVIHLLYSSDTQTDAVRRIANLLEIEQSVALEILDVPLRWMLPEQRAQLGPTLDAVEDRVADRPVDGAGRSTALSVSAGHVTRALFRR
jgi:hypothetical protein